LAEICFSGKYTHAEVKKLLRGNAGINAYLGTNDVRDVIKMIDEDNNEKAKLIYDAFIYQISKEIGAMSVNVNGKVDAIILTGGVAYNKGLTDKIEERVGFIAPVYVYPGEMELEALTYGALNVINGVEEAKIYE